MADIDLSSNLISLMQTEANERTAKTSHANSLMDKAGEKFDEVFQAINSKLNNKNDRRSETQTNYNTRNDNKKIDDKKTAIKNTNTTQDSSNIKTAENNSTNVKKADTEKNTKTVESTTNTKSSDTKTESTENTTITEAETAINDTSEAVSDTLIDLSLVIPQAIIIPTNTEEQPKMEIETTQIPVETIEITEMTTEKKAELPAETTLPKIEQVKSEDGLIELSKLNKFEKINEEIKMEIDADMEFSYVDNYAKNTATEKNTKTTENNINIFEPFQDDIESVEIQKSTTTEIILPQQKETATLKTDNTLKPLEEVEEVASTPTQSSLTDSNADDSSANQDSTDLKFVAENLFEKNAFLNSDKSIIFNKVLDNVSANKSVVKTDVLDQINQNMSKLSNDNTKVNIILRPENLGRITIELQNGKDGLIAKFATENPQVKEFLDKSLDNLKNNLATQGVNVNNVVVKVENASSMSNGNMSNFTNENFNQGLQTNLQNQNQTAYKPENQKNTATLDNEDIPTEELSAQNTEENNVANRLGKIDYRI